MAVGKLKIKKAFHEQTGISLLRYNQTAVERICTGIPKVLPFYLQVYRNRGGGGDSHIYVTGASENLRIVN